MVLMSEICTFFMLKLEFLLVRMLIFTNFAPETKMDMML